MSEAGETKRPGPKIKWGLWIALLAIAGVIVAVWMVFNAEHGVRIARSQNMEAISLLKSTRGPLSEYFQDHGKWPENLDKILSTSSGSHTKSVGITRGAGGAGEIELTATMRTEGADERVAGKKILLVSPDGGKTWTCKRGTMLPEHVPSDCRTN